MNIEELIDRGESQSLEFKESLKLRDEIGETVSTFSNSDGGTVMVGVSDGGGIPRVDISYFLVKICAILWLAKHVIENK